MTNWFWNGTQSVDGPFANYSSLIRQLPVDTKRAFTPIIGEYFNNDGACVEVFDLVGELEFPPEPEIPLCPPAAACIQYTPEEGVFTCLRHDPGCPCSDRIWDAKLRQCRTPKA